MHQHCPLILLELTLHVSNYLVCGFVHLGLSNVHNMNFAHFTNYINNRCNSGVYMVQDFRCVHGTRHVDTDLRPSVKGHSFSENSHVLTVEKTIRHTTCDLLFVRSKCEWYSKHDSNHTTAVLIIICVFMKSRIANRRLYQIRRSRNTASYFYTTVGWTHSIKTAHNIQYVGTSIHVNIL